MHSVRGITLRRAAILRSQPRDLGLTSSTACLLLPHKPNPRPSPNPPSHRSDPSARYRQYHSKHIAKLEKELGLALEEQQVESSLAGKPTSPSPRSVKAPPDETQSRERTGCRPEELQDTSRHGTAQGLEEWELQETGVVVEGGAVAMQQQEEPAAQKEELGYTAVGDQQDLVEVVYADDPEEKEATDALLAAQPKIPYGHRFRLWDMYPAASWTQDRGNLIPNRIGGTSKQVRFLGQQRQHANVNATAALRTILLRLVERDIMRVHRMRYNRCSRSKKILEYLVDKSRWITKDQLRISLYPMLAAKLKGN
ncbi:hypothetical protein LAWI1_G003347 [Lachnellula willkommii]|uniref:Uncharacterized protein n=1 Tax=Lachnellula willkommii TaxID=215461 RepID=A0A559M7S1_9HELO|nr:hypothetical protein LAWI1_G003347 [Lachnellula willkommii]